jgi:hypothetical protein
VLNGSVIEEEGSYADHEDANADSDRHPAFLVQWVAGIALEADRTGLFQGVSRNGGNWNNGLIALERMGTTKGTGKTADSPSSNLFFESDSGDRFAGVENDLLLHLFLRCGTLLCLHRGGEPVATPGNRLDDLPARIVPRESLAQ